MSRNRFNVPYDFDTIAQAMRALPDTGGVIDLEPGLYIENLVWDRPGPLRIRGCNVPGPCWVSTPLCCIAAASGTVLAIGDASHIADPCVYISGVAIRNLDGGKCDYGIHVGRSRCPKLDTVDLLNFQPSGVGIFLDGSGGWHEWSAITDCGGSNCATWLLLHNATRTIVRGGVVMAINSMVGTVGISTTGASDTLRVSDLALDELETGVILSGAPEEAAMIRGLRVEYHIDQHPSARPASGVIVNTNSNIIEGSFWGTAAAIKFAATAQLNRYLAMGSGNTIVPGGTGNISL